MHALVAPASADELIVDDADPTVQLSGSWQTTATTPGFYGGGYLFHTPGHGAATARWPFPASGSAGRYRVYASRSSGANRATAARYQITSAHGVTAVHVNQKNGGTDWHILGTFTFDPGANEGGVSGVIVWRWIVQFRPWSFGIVLMPSMLAMIGRGTEQEDVAPGRGRAEGPTIRLG